MFLLRRSPRCYPPPGTPQPSKAAIVSSRCGERWFQDISVRVVGESVSSRWGDIDAFRVSQGGKHHSYTTSTPSRSRADEEVGRPEICIAVRGGEANALMSRGDGARLANVRAQWRGCMDVSAGRGWLWSVSLAALVGGSVERAASPPYTEGGWRVASFEEEDGHAENAGGRGEDAEYEEQVLIHLKVCCMKENFRKNGKEGEAKKAKKKQLPLIGRAIQLNSALSGCYSAPSPQKFLQKAQIRASALKSGERR
ncbi:hypothetical protein FB451DRAFT_1186058 [Mycena latifolia]|nr:hypothetical protein FB451DRAFT_1186058 [Mycena latifolia]